MTRMDAPGLYAAVSEASVIAHTHDGAVAVVDLANDNWDDIARREANAEDAETCRLVALAAAQLEDFPALRLWRARALSRFAAIGWTEGVASILMGEAFAELARVNGDYPDGKTLDRLRASSVALGIFDEMERFAFGPGSGFRLGPGSPTRDVIKRFFHEKRGFLLLIGSTANRVAARRSYELALEAAQDNERGQVKVKLGLALIDYLESPSRSASEAIDRTEELGKAALALGRQDLSDIAAMNVHVMRAGGDALHAYEIL